MTNSDWEDPLALKDLDAKLPPRVNEPDQGFPSKPWPAEGDWFQVDYPEQAVLDAENPVYELDVQNEHVEQFRLQDDCTQGAGVHADIEPGMQAEVVQSEEQLVDLLNPMSTVFQQSYGIYDPRVEVHHDQYIPYVGYGGTGYFDPYRGYKAGTGYGYIDPYSGCQGCQIPKGGDRSG